MSQTIPDITVTSLAWVDINAASNIPVGTYIQILNKTSNWCLIYEGDIAPSVSSSDGWPITDLNKSNPLIFVKEGSLRIWAKSLNDVVTTKLNVQEV